MTSNQQQQAKINCIFCKIDIIRNSEAHNHIHINSNDDIVCLECVNKCDCDCCMEKKEAYQCLCQNCGEIIELAQDETPEEQEKWFNAEDEVKYCDTCYG